ncbi:MAG: ExeM/NucH family extracellular endonuclease [Anaerolineales bacterium]|nr:ExeM/NucH family extracellular endonuclease [Anaerolineales bacterium]
MNYRPQLINLVLAIMLLISALGYIPTPVQAAPGGLLISQVYGGGGNSGAYYTHDFIELFNAGDAPVDITGWSVQYASASGTTWAVTSLSGTVQPGSYYLIQQAQGAGGEEPLPTPDATGTIYMSATNGKVALVDNSTALSGSCPLGVVDFVGYGGNANCFEGSGSTGTLSNTTAAIRNSGGCTDTDDNAADFSVGEPTPRNSTSPTNVCGLEPEIDLKINEFVFNHVGTDTHEYIEVFGEPNTDYSSYTLLQIEGDFSGTATGLIDSVHHVGETDENGIWWTGYLYNKLENGTVTLLLVKDFNGAVGDDIDTDDNGEIDTTYWSEIVDSVAVSDGGASDHTYGMPVLSAYYDGLPYTPGGASRIPDGYDTGSSSDWVRNDFDGAGIPGFTGSIQLGEAYNTPGEPNMVYTPPPEACGDPFTPIFDIQGDGMTTPLYGQEVATEGVVVGDFQVGKNGFFIQDPVGDGDENTSDGIFVYAPLSMEVNVGDHVRVRGTATEYYDLTQIGSVIQVWSCDIGIPLPDPVELALPVESVDDFEPYEGMLVTFPQALVISEYYNFGRFGEIVLTSERHITPTAMYAPGPDAIAAAQAYLLDRITLDDGSNVQNPDPAMHPNGLEFNLDNLFRGGDLVANVTGVMDYGFGIYRIQPTQGADYTPTNHRTESPEIGEGDIKIASFNVYNYFTTLDNQGNICGPLGDMECRGADNAEELQRQRAKILAALSIIEADVVGLMEVENDRPGPDPDYAVADLVAGLNDLLGEGTYDYIATGAIGTDAIKVALIYKPGGVTPVGEYAILDSTYDPDFLDDYNRPILAQTFMDNLSGELFIVAVNHLKSKGSSCEAVGDPDLGDGAGNCNLTRDKAARVQVEWLASDPTGTGVEYSLIIGDLNSYDKEDPINTIKAGADGIPGNEDDYLDMIYEILGEAAYSYVFDGQIGYLDYIMVSASLSDFVTDLAIWHINADEASLIDYDTTYKKPAQAAIYAPDAYRSSDHDPVIISLTFDYELIAVDIKPTSCPNPLNVKDRGVLPVAILGSENFDVTQIDLSTVKLENVSPLRWNYEDIAAPFEPYIGKACELDCSTDGPDGYLDIILHFSSQAVVDALGDIADGDVLVLSLTGNLLAENGGTPIIGEDVVSIMKK